MKVNRVCECVCHKVGLFGLHCCPCTTKLLDEFVNGKLGSAETGGEKAAQ